MAYIYKNGAWTDYEPYKYGVNTVSFTSYPFTVKSKTSPITATIYGNMQQSGTPTPAAPIYPTETGDKTGNLFDKSTITTDYYAITTGLRENSNFYCSDFIPITATTYYFQNVIGDSYQNSVVVYDANKQGLRYERLIGGYQASGAITFENGDAYIRINCYYQTDVDTVMVNIGSTALPYEPYGFKIPILSGGTTTPIYMGEVQSTRQIKELVLDGSEDWAAHTSIADCYSLDLQPNSGITGNGLCSHFEKVETTSQLTNGTFVSGQNYSYFKDTTVENLSGWKSYLQQQYVNGTPVRVWYALANETTGIVNEPIRKIGDYTDSVTASIPVIIGSDTVNIDTSLKPSAVAAPSLSWGSGEDHKYSGGAWS